MLLVVLIEMTCLPPPRLASSSTISTIAEVKIQNLHFKLRVLDLVEIFMRKQATNALVWRLYQPLLSALRRHPADGPQAPLYARLVAAYGKLTHAKEYAVLLLLFVCVHGEESMLVFLLLLLPGFPSRAPRLSLIWKLTCRAWGKPRDMPIRRSCWRSCAMASVRCSGRICTQPCTWYASGSYKQHHSPALNQHKHSIAAHSFFQN